MLTKEERAAWIAQREAEHQKIKDRIRAAGIKYPPLGWDDMGASEKDMWEDRKMRTLDRLERTSK